MKEKGNKIAGAIIVSEGILAFIVGIGEGTFSMMLMGIGLCIVGCLYFLKKENNA